MFLVKLHEKVFSSDIFKYVVTFLSMWTWESDWSATGHLGSHLAIFHV